MVRSINPDFQVHASPESPKLPLTRSMSTSSVGQCSEDFDVPSMATLDLAILDNKDEDKLAQDAFLSVPCLNFPSLFFQFSLDNCCKLQVNLASLLEGPGGFLEAAQDNAWAAAIVPSKPQNLEKVSKKPRVGPKNGSLSCCEGKPWWKVYDKSLEHSPLEMWWDTDEKKKNQDGWQKLCIQVLPPRRCCEQIFGAKCPPRRSQICSSENWYSGTFVQKV